MGSKKTESGCTIVGMNNTLFLVSDLTLVACILAAFLLDRLTDRRR